MFINVKSENVEIDASNIHNILSTEDTKSKNLLIKNVILTRNKLNNDKTIKKYVSKIDKAIEKVKENAIVLKKLKIKIEEIKEDIK
jgi:flagellar basal body rod protein FlgC